MPGLISADDRGDTLIEILITVVILSLATVAIVGALTTTVRSVAGHRGTTTATTLLKDWAEAAVQQIEQTSGGFTACSPNYASSVSTSAAGFTIPSADTLSATVQYWSTGTSTWVSSCPSTPVGIQLITATLSAPGSAQQQLQFVVRDPAYGSSYAGF